jgi:hypothetical protein
MIRIQFRAKPLRQSKGKIWRKARRFASAELFQRGGVRATEWCGAERIVFEKEASQLSVDGSPDEIDDVGEKL